MFEIFSTHNDNLTTDFLGECGLTYMAPNTGPFKNIRIFEKKFLHFMKTHILFQTIFHIGNS